MEDRADDVAKGLSREEKNRVLAIELGLPVVHDLSSYHFKRERLEKIPYAFASKNLALPIQEMDGKVLIAIADPLDVEPLEEMRLMLDAEVSPVYAPSDVIRDAIQQWYRKESGGASQLLANMGASIEDGQEIAVYDLLDDRQEQASIIKLLNLIILEAIEQGASDIHFEPFENGMRVRYRIDGVLQERHAPPQEYQAQIMTRIKVMAKLDIAERRLPQDGRIKLKMGSREIDFRVSTLPVSGGERIVLRILDRGSVALGLDKLGMLQEVDQTFRKLITLPEGILLITGPTGSGKTTTLYSGICQIMSSESNIMTIEDPVEYNIEGIAQIGVQSKIDLTFAAGLRHILRQDPDVIMIGEIRDKEAAEIAIQAALTGHLVMSTLHTNDAPSAVTRLVDMGIEPYLISSSVVGALAQRLVRRICPSCKIAYKTSTQELKSIGLKEETPFLYRGKGCKACFGLGYRGRHGVYELMTIGNEIKKQIIKSPDAIELRRIALENGMLSLLQHGSELVKQGITTVSEVLRVCRAVEEI